MKSGRLYLILLLGTSIGGVHACFLAATADQGPERADALTRIWSELRLEALFPSPSRALLRLPLRLRRRDAAPADRHHGLLDTRPLEALLGSFVPWGEIGANAAAGRFRALCVAATQAETGRVVLFGQGADLPRMVGGRLGFELRLVMLGGLGILDRIERVGFDVFTRRPSLSRADWGRLVLRAAVS